MTAIETARREPTGDGAPAAPPLRTRARDLLGRAHYERMRQAMAPDLVLPTWPGLTDAQREPYRQRTEHLVPTVLDLVACEFAALSHPALEDSL